MMAQDILCYFLVCRYWEEKVRDQSSVDDFLDCSQYENDGLCLVLIG